MKNMRSEILRWNGESTMSGRMSRRSIECVLVDVNTQHDFCDRDGALPVENAATLIGSLRRVVAWGRRNQAPVVSSMESHRPFELSDSGHPIHCVDGSCGQQKLAFTLFPTRAKLEFDNTHCVPVDLFRRCQQVIFRKRSDDFLNNPKADRLLTQLSVYEFVLFGTGLETAVKAIALGLLARGKRVTIVVDACGYWNKATADLARRQLEAKGARFITVEELLSRRLARRWRYPNPLRNGHNGNGRLAKASSSDSLCTPPVSPENNGRSGGSVEGAPHVATSPSSDSPLRSARPDDKMRQSRESR